MLAKKRKLISVSIILFILITGIFIVSGINKTFALTNNTLPDTMKSKASDPVDDRINLVGVPDNPKYLVDESSNTTHVVYCLEREKGWPNGYTFRKDAAPLDNGYAYIVLNGAPSKQLTGNSEQDKKNDIYLTQIALWFYQDRRDGIDDSSDGVLTAQEKSTIKTKSYYNSVINPLITGALTAKENGVKPDPKISATSNNLSYTNIEGKTYLTSSNISVNSNNPFNDYQISLNVNNYEILDSNGNVIKTVKDGSPTKNEKISSSNTFKIRIPIEDVAKLDNNKLTISLIANYTQNDTYLYKPTQDPELVQEIAVAAIEATEKTTSTSLDLTVPTGNLTIIKHDSKGNNLQGARLLIENNYGYSQTITTTNSPQTLNNLIPGEYTITELSAPTGYIISDVKNVTVSANSTQSATIVDEDITVSIKKIDKDTKKSVAGAKINIYSEGDLDNPVISVITGETEEDNNYLINNKLSIGTYYAKEVEAPSGYIRDTTTKTLNVTKDNYNLEVEFQDSKNQIDIYKVDDSSNNISGVTLAVYNKAGDVFVERWVTDGNKHTLTGLPVGTYYVKEEKVPSGYVLSQSTKEFTVTMDEGVSPSSIYFVNTKRQVVINKVDEHDTPVPNAVLRITNEAGTYDKTFTTTTSNLVLNDLEPGEYTITEQKAPDGFILNKEKKKFTVLSDTTNLTVTFKNERNKIKIGKVNENDEYIAGAKLQLTAPDGSLVDTWTSGLEPHEISNISLKHGTYKLVELEAPDGYILNKEVMNINIDENSDNNYVYKMINTNMDISVIKKDENGNYLEGVTLELLNSDKQRVKVWQTTDTPYKLNNIAKGTYYVREVATLDGYILDTTLHKLVIDDDTTVKKIEIENKPITVEIAKIDSVTNELIAGAKLKLSTIDGEEIETWQTTTTKKVFKKLKAGKYILEEISPSEGYISNGNKLTFEVLNTGKVQNVYMKDNYVSVSVEGKKLKVDTNKVKGFRFILSKKDGTKVEEWVSTENTYTTKELQNGTYVLKEVEVPNGYFNLSSPYEFIINDDNTTDVVKLVNKPITVSISKKDFTDSDEIEGAELVLKDSSDKTIDTWVSTTSPHQIDKLPVGKYKLTETIAPDGYVLSRETVEFEVKETGDIQTAVMYNQPKVIVPNTSKKIPIWIYIISSILIVSGLCVFGRIFIKSKV